MTDDAFYTRDGTTFTASPATVGPWDPALQHGGPVAALLGTTLERAALDAAASASAGATSGARISQFALEFFAPVPVAAMNVTTEVVRPGKKIALWRAGASVGGRAAVAASAWLLLASEGRNPEARLRLDDEPVPPLPKEAVSTYFTSVPRFGYGDALEWRFAEGGFEAIGPAAVWARLRVAVVQGEPVTPLGRVLAMVDSANGISAELDVGRFLFVPVNLTVTLARYPAGEWVGMRAVTSLASDGVGFTRARLFDERGTIGEALQSLYVSAR